MIRENILWSWVLIPTSPTKTRQKDRREEKEYNIFWSEFVPRVDFHWLEWQSIGDQVQWRWEWIRPWLAATSSPSAIGGRRTIGRLYNTSLRSRSVKQIEEDNINIHLFLWEELLKIYFCNILFCNMTLAREFNGWSGKYLEAMEFQFVLLTMHNT